MSSEEDTRILNNIAIIRTVRVIAPVLATTILFILTVFIFVIPTMRESLMEQKREKLQELTQSVWSLLESYEEKERDGNLSHDEAQRGAVDEVSRIRYGSDMKDYFWINDTHCRMIAHPYRKDLIGRDLTNLKDSNGKLMAQEFVNTACAYGGGYVEYMWPKDGPSERVALKISYVKLFKPWGWVVGTGVFVEDVEREIKKVTHSFIVSSGGILCIILILSFYMIWHGMDTEKARQKAEKALKKSYEDLERRVDDRTVELKDTNTRLQEEIAERKNAEDKISRSETRLRSLVRILQYPAETTQELLDNALDEAIKITESKIGYIYFYHEDVREFVLNTWSKDVMSQCSVADIQTCYDLDKTGIWGEAVRQRRPIVLNDFQACNPLKKGYPEGHAHLVRFMTVPVFKGAQIVAVVGVANKNNEYDETDIFQITLLMDAVWKSVEMKRAEEERKKLELQLLQAQKLESIGSLAAGIAHEINTPIQYVGDNTRFLLVSFNDLSALLHQYMEAFDTVKKGIPPDELEGSLKAAIELTDLEYLKEEIPKAIQQSLEGIGRVREIVLAMKEFSHPDSMEKKAANINQLISSTVTVARNEWKYAANMEVELDSTMPLIPCLPGEFNQVILNIIINAAQAITARESHDQDEKGTITIKTSHDDRFAQIHISDTGTGIPENIRSRIFDPFFTTKEVGKGTGQGLAMAHAVIVEKHGGSIDVDSEEGKGTIFTIMLPIAG